MAAEKNNKTLNVPNLRFPEFSGEWEKVHLSRIVTRVTRKNKNNEKGLMLRSHQSFYIMRYDSKTAETVSFSPIRMLRMLEPH